MRRRIISTLAGAAVVTGIFAAVALALTTGELEPKATEWQAKACTSALLTSRRKAAGEEAAVCFSLDRAQEDKSSITALQAKVATLEANAVKPPSDFAFFENTPAPATSPVFDAAGYTTVAFTVGQAECAGNSSVEASNDQVTWVREGSVGEGNSLPVVARYYRVSVVKAGGCERSANFTALAEFSG
jgi:hypothetical protein